MARANTLLPFHLSQQRFYLCIGRRGTVSTIDEAIVLPTPRVNRAEAHAIVVFDFADSAVFHSGLN